MQVTILFSIEYKDSVFHFSEQVRKTRRPIQKERSLREGPQVGKNRGFTRRYFRVTRLKSAERRSDGPRTAKESDRKHEDGTKEAENPMNGDSNNPKR